jgi:sugar phosphate isomerase/epimerase
MKLRLACADFTFPFMSHEHSLDIISMLDFDGVDIGLFEKRSHLQPSREFRSVHRSAKALLRKVSDRGLKVADVFLQMDPDFVKFAVNAPQASRRRKAREWFLRTLEYAAAVECPHVTALPGVFVDGESRRDSWKSAREELAWRVARAADCGLVFGVEPHIGSIIQSPSAARRMAEEVPGLTYTLDYTHFARRGIADSKAEPLIQYASHFHVRGARRGRLQCSFQENAIDYRRILRVMKQTGYSGYIGIEYVWTEWERCNEVDNLSETIFFRDFVRGLKV